MAFGRDGKLLERAQRGDLNALEELCEREWRPVYGIAYQAVRNVSEAQDLTQEVFLRALGSLHRYRDTGVPFSAYLGTIARNLVRNRWRQRRPHLVSLDEAAALPSDADGPEERALSAVEADRIVRALSTLSDDHYTVIRLRIFEGRSAAFEALEVNQEERRCGRISRQDDDAYDKFTFDVDRGESGKIMTATSQSHTSAHASVQPVDAGRTMEIAEAIASRTHAGFNQLTLYETTDQATVPGDDGQDHVFPDTWQLRANDQV